MERLKKRADFVAAARAVSKARPGLVLQARARGDEARACVGFTATRKIGNAVRRNRARRRLREVVRLTLGPAGLAKASMMSSSPVRARRRAGGPKVVNGFPPDALFCP